MHSFEIFHRYEQSHWHLKDIPWERIQRDRVRPEDILLARSAVMGECNSIAALHGFLNEAIDDYDFSAYASIWGYQELQHHYAFKTWLQHLNADVETQPVEASRAPYPPGITFAATLATNIISELTVCHGYLYVSRQVAEPVLKDIITRASHDEARHAREFLYYTGRRLDRHPTELASVLETLYVYMADPDKLIKHPVTVFKGASLELFEALDDTNCSRLRQKIFRTFSTLTGFPLDTPASIRRALRHVWVTD